MLYLTSDDFVSLTGSKVIVDYKYIRNYFTYYLLATLDTPFISNHPVCGHIETSEILISARGIKSFMKFSSFPIEVCIYTPDYLIKGSCKSVLAIGYLNQKE